MSKSVRFVFVCAVCVNICVSVWFGACGSSLSGAGVGKWVGSCHRSMQLFSLVAILNRVGGYLCLGCSHRRSLPIERDAGGWNGVRFSLYPPSQGAFAFSQFAIWWKELRSFVYMHSCFEVTCGWSNCFVYWSKKIYFYTKDSSFKPLFSFCLVSSS